VDANGNPIVEPGLWGLTFGGSGRDGSPNTLYFSAGINGYRDGVFASLDPVPEPSSIVLCLIGGGTIALFRRRLKVHVLFSRLDAR
jgi:hypothetical protein